MKKIIIILLIIFFYTYSNNISGTFLSENSYTDNISKTSDFGKDYKNYGNLDLYYHEKNSNHHLSYSLTMLHFDSLYTNDYFLNSFSYDYSKPFKNNKNNSFSGGATLSIRSAIGDNDIYDYMELYSYASTLFKKDQSHWKLKYTYKNKKYKYLPEYSHSRHTFNLKSGHSFNSGTTIIIKNDIGLKFFGTENENISGNGRGRSTLLDSPSNYMITAQEVFSFRIAQSLSSYAGIYVEYRKQLSILNEINSYNLEHVAQEEDLFDDPYAYESNTFSTRLTIMLPQKIRLINYGFYSTRNYLTENIINSSIDTLSNSVLREDSRKGIDITLSRSFYFKKNIFSSITPSIYYTFLNSYSNSYLYNFNENSAGLELKINF